MVETVVDDAPEVGTLEIDVNRLKDPDFSVVDMVNINSNNVRPCVWEGGFQDRRNYKIWEWSAIKWLRNLVKDQLEYENCEENVMVQPSAGGYYLNIEGTDIHYEITHSGAQGDVFNIDRVPDLMRQAENSNVNERPGIFKDTTLNRRQAVKTFATRLMVNSIRKRKQGTEGVYSLEKTSMRIKDQS